MSRSLSFRTSAESAQRLDELTKSTQRPRSWLLQQALDRYLDDQAWQIDHIQAGLDELRAGRAIDHKAVSHWLASWGGEDEGEPPR